MWTAYYTPATLEDALSLLAAHAPRARLIAGGTDLLIELERGQRPGVDVLIDITRILGLSAITHDAAAGAITLGPLVTHQHLVGSPIIAQYALPLMQAAWEVGAPQIRNRATLAGNLVTGSPANDGIVPLRALGASVVLRSVRGERTVPIAAWYVGFRQPDLAPDEMVTAITFPALGEHERGIFLKLGLRRAQAISVVNCAAVVGFDAAGTVTRASIALGSVAPVIIEADAAARLVGRPLTPDAIAEAAQAAAAQPTPISDVRATAAYRTEMIRVLVTRALRALAAGTQAAHTPKDPAMLWGPHHGRAPHAAATTLTLSAAPGGSPVQAGPFEADTAIRTCINGVERTIATGAEKTLLRFLREDAGLTGTKEGCSEGECGACTVLLDGAAVMACMVPAPRAHHAEVVTIEGLSEYDTLHPLQSAFIETAAVQCGYCTPGFVMAGAALLDEHPQPTRAQIETAISGNLCRCTGYYPIVQAIEQAARPPEPAPSVHP